MFAVEVLLRSRSQDLAIQVNAHWYIDFFIKKCIFHLVNPGGTVDKYLI